MANRTDPAAKSIRGTNPQNLVEKIVRSKIYQNTYWKEQCFGLTAETLVDKAMELDHIGGTFGGNRKPTPFMCLIMKMLQIQPEKEIVIEFIKNDDYKYVRVLGAFYLRLTGTDTDVYQYLEPLYNDYRKVRQKSPDGRFSLTHVDEVIDELLTKDYSCDIAMPHGLLSHLARWNLEKVLWRKILKRRKRKRTTNNSMMMMMNLKMRDMRRIIIVAGVPYETETGIEDMIVTDIGRERERRDRDRGGRRRSHSRSRSRSRDRKDRTRKRHARNSISPRRRDGTEATNGTGEEPKKKKEKKEKKPKDDGTDHPDPEIAEANRLRASLGLKPLK
uniref:Pre-mRNA-splicing factor 38 n=1 Tax=Cannabis sativa TaxID=3483 RepID=A0A803PWC8_CANSA